MLDKNRGVARTCYDEALALRPGLAGKVIVDVRLARGQEPVVLLHESTMNFAKVDNCIVKALKKLPYPQGTDRLVAVRYVYGFPEVAADRR